jgi:3-deoxy-D-manno-octulosonic-acid transferase
VSILLYNLFLFVYQAAIRIYSVVNPKARKWVAGRRGWRREVRSKMAGAGDHRIWIHCASLGEFEQAAPVIEALRGKYPRYKIILTFFSPSGYEIRKRYRQADYVFYLPMDGRSNAHHFVRLIKPNLVLFVKYEFWYHYLRQLNGQGIPVLLICAAFRKDQIFFKPYGGFFRRMLGFFDLIFLQDQASRTLLHRIGLGNRSIIAGDTRYDRVAEIASFPRPIEPVEAFKASGKLLIAGSTWPEDERILRGCLGVLPPNWKMVLAPHEIDPPHLAWLKQTFGSEIVFFSEWQDHNAGGSCRILVMDNMGMLSRLYAYGEIAFIGGGFRKGGIHNILEPAVFGLPVVFGPVFTKFVEATQLVSRDLAFSVRDEWEGRAIIQSLASDEARRSKIHQALRTFVSQQVGSTALICAELARCNWLIV